MHPRINEILDEILKVEGGFVDDPKDKGGATKHGISLRYARGIGLDLDGDRDTDIDDIKLVTPDIARKLYLEDFYKKPKIDRLPEALQAVVFDVAINSGPARAIILLQQVINQFRTLGNDVFSFPMLSEDGLIGTRSLKAIEEVHNLAGAYLINAYVDARHGWYRYIVNKDPSQQRFLKGWTRRAESYRVPT